VAEDPKPPRPPANPPPFKPFISIGAGAIGKRQDTDASKRSPTLTGMPAPPLLPGEIAPTVLAPPRSPMRETLRRPTPPSVVLKARRSDPPPGPLPYPEAQRHPYGLDDEPPTDPTASESPEAIREAQRKALLERDRRAAAEAAQETYPPKVEDRTPRQAPPSLRSSTPPGAIKFEGRGFKFTLPHLALVAILGVVGGGSAVAKIASDKATDTSEVMAELRTIGAEVKGLRQDVRDIRDEQNNARLGSKATVRYVKTSLAPLVASLRKLGVKLEYDGSEDPAKDVEFHAPPLGGTAPPIQPKATLPEPPRL
jgi:hypothetical protein